MNLIKPHINPKNNKIHKFKEIRVCRVCKINEKVCYKRSTKEYICWSCANKQRTFIKKPIGYNYGPNQGYNRVRTEDGRQHMHRYVVEQYIGRKLKEDETIHHIDFNKLNNDIKNLYICSNSDHLAMNIPLMQLGYSFLSVDQHIWFDRQNKKYVLNEIKSLILDEPKIILPEYTKQISKKVSMKKSKRMQLYYPKCQIRRHRFVSYYRIVMESFLNRKLERGETIHHINGDHLDNSINNLIVVSNKEHRRLEVSLLECATELYKRKLIYFDNGIYKREDGYVPSVLKITTKEEADKYLEKHFSHFNIKLPIRHRRIIRKSYKKKTKKAQLFKVSQCRKTTHRLNIKATITTKEDEDAA